MSKDKYTKRQRYEKTKRAKDKETKRQTKSPKDKETKRQRDQKRYRRIEKEAKRQRDQKTKRRKDKGTYCIHVLVLNYVLNRNQHRTHKKNCEGFAL